MFTCRVIWYVHTLQLDAPIHVHVCTLVAQLAMLLGLPRLCTKAIGHMVVMATSFSDQT